MEVSCRALELCEVVVQVGPVEALVVYQMAKGAGSTGRFSVSSIGSISLVAAPICSTRKAQ